jgi:hypothetical protein
LPNWNSTFAVPIEGTSFAVAQLLPSSVRLEGNAFVLTLAPLSVQAQLGALCLPCRPLAGQTVPKPAFDAALATPLPLPPDVLSATITSGWIHFQLTNGFGFDPVRPGGSQTGRLVIEVQASTGAPRGTFTLDGAMRAFAPSTTIRDSIQIGSPVPVSGLQVRLQLESPAGAPVLVDPQQAVQLAVMPGPLVVSEAQIVVENRQVTANLIQLDLTGIDDFLVRRVRGGKLLLTLSNDPALGGTFTLNITGGLAPVSKTVVLPPGATSAEVPMTGEELRRILGQSVSVAITGGVTSSAARLTPSSSFTVQPLLVLELGVD